MIAINQWRVPMRFLRALLIIGLLVGLVQDAASAYTHVDLGWQLDVDPITSSSFIDPYSITFDYASVVSGTGNVFPNGTFKPQYPGNGYVFWGLRSMVNVSAKESLFGTFLTGANGTGFGVNDDIIVRVNNQSLPIWASQTAFNFAIPDYVWLDGENTIEVVYWNSSYGYLDALFLWVPQPNTNTTPIPAAVWLLGSGLAGLVGLRKIFKK